MTLLLLIADLLVAIVVTLASTIQVLYLEALRIRARELPSLEFFKSTLEAKLGMETELGALTFSLVKHIGLAALGCLTLAVTAQNANGFEAIVAAILLVTFFAILGTYAIPQIIAGPTATARWVGVQNAIGNLSGIFGPILTGFIVEDAGYNTAFVVAAAVAAAGALWWVWGVPRIVQIELD